MREIRQSGSEGGGGETNRLSLPLFGRENVQTPDSEESKLSSLKLFTVLRSLICVAVAPALPRRDAV